jgi:hypothetical protein
MAETVTTIQEAPGYLQPGIEKFLEGATAQAGQALDRRSLAHYNKRQQNKQQNKLVSAHYNLMMIKGL